MCINGIGWFYNFLKNLKIVPILRNKTAFLPTYKIQCAWYVFQNMCVCFLKMYCLEESTLNLSMIVRHRKHHFVFLFVVVMDFKLNNLKLCSPIKGLFVSAQWYHKVIHKLPFHWVFIKSPVLCYPLNTRCLV